MFLKHYFAKRNNSRYAGLTKKAAFYQTAIYNYYKRSGGFRPPLRFLILVSDSEFLQRIERTVEDIEVYISLYAGQLSCVCVLPEVPRALVFHLVYIVMCYPVGIVVEYGRVQIVLLKFIICVYDRLHVEIGRASCRERV